MACVILDILGKNQKGAPLLESSKGGPFLFIKRHSIPSQSIFIPENTLIFYAIVLSTGL